MNTRRTDLERLESITGGPAPLDLSDVDAGGPGPLGDGEDFSAAWCTDALRAGGVIDSAAVVAVRVSELGPDTPGFLGQLRRLHIDYDRPDAGPPTVVAKRNSPEEFNRALAAGMGYYEREYRVYRQLAPSLPLRTATHYYSALDGDRFVLLMADLGGARVGNQSTETPIADVEAAVDEAAFLHATFADGAGLDGFDWIRPLDANAAVYDAALETRWSGFRTHFPDALAAAAVEAGERLLGRMADVMTTLSVAPATLVHGDFRIDNIVFDAPPDPERPLVIDWQGVGRGHGAFDLAQMIGLSLEPLVRRAGERALLDRYAAAVEAHTGTAVSRDDLFDAYRLAMAYPFAMGIAQSDMDTTQAGSDPGIWVRRAGQAVADNGIPLT